ncbi:aminotransferase class V-fold PLP-dependent enzyme [Nocardiopsis xinjiangensis]|uniref:aminotransferase class V-fold PLP-dependent enzyme n=1 Tax=Nocardiopsis xinjiangensis TaxID=124285 RepID=UPI001F4D2B1D|nr:aminotransferase class V-fold PLP-dependent enzyme [Nocardiopsis xinjiangensis]
MGFDVAGVRAETAGVGERVHLNSAGAALMPDQVVQEVLWHVRSEARLGGYEAAEMAADRVEGFYASVARLLGARPQEVAFAESATRAWELALGSVPLGAGDRVLTTVSEYSSNGLGLVKAAGAVGARVEVVADDADGVVDVGALERALDQGGVVLVAINHMPTHNGLVNPVERVGRACRARGVLFLVDACQSVGQVQVDVDRVGCDFLTATGRKFLRGPRGTGLLYARAQTAGLGEPAVVDVSSAEWLGERSYRVRGDARRFESFERSVAGQLGLAVAADYAYALGMDAVAERVGWLGEVLRERLSVLAGVRVWDRGRVGERSGIVTFSVEGVGAEWVRAYLARAGVNVSVSRVHNQVWEDARMPEEVVRASVHYYNTEEELAVLVALVAERVGA